MKKTALQSTKDYINDNKQFMDGNIADYLLDNLVPEEILTEYLTEDEIIEYENNPARRKEMQFKIVAFILSNFNFDISEFIY